MFDEEQHTHSLQHASLQSVDMARHVFLAEPLQLAVCVYTGCIQARRWA